MKIHLHQTHHQLADLETIFHDLKLALSTEEGLHLFPELFLTGYPLNDLCLQRPFIKAYQNLLNQIDEWSLQSKDIGHRGPTCALMGGLKYILTPQGRPEKIENVIYQLIPGEKLKAIYTKRLLPNYDIFDEKKYFSPGQSPCVLEWQGQRLGLMICEDMWPSSIHPIDPCEELAKLGPFHAVINLSASPFDWAKLEKRLERGSSISHQMAAPFIYVNRVGGEDEILFDGQSFLMNGDELIWKGPSFEKSKHSFTLSPFRGERRPYHPEKINTWDSLFTPQWENLENKWQLKIWSDETCEQVFKALCFGLQEYAQKSQMKKFLVALSGGIDSALVLTLVKKSLRPGQSVEAIYMPGKYSSGLSWDLSLELCKQQDIPLYSLPIKFFHVGIKNAFETTFGGPFEGLTDENVQSRLRGLCLYTRSNQTGALVINTSNKSELAVGYSTQYGDSVGALSLLGDLYKEQVYQLSRWINKKFNHCIPEKILTRAPTAELRENQKDRDSLPPYERLDLILEGILSYYAGQEELIEMGLPASEVSKVFRLYLNSEYKRRQFCPVLKISSKSFGFGYRVPITKGQKIFNLSDIKTTIP